MKTNKWVIFLDIDGVLNNIPLLHNKVHMAKSMVDHHDNHISQTLMRRFNTLVEDTEAVVVLSSAWRILYTVEEINALFKRNGATFDIISRTENLPYERGTEISKWLRDNSKEIFGIPHYDFYKYIILDDDSDMLLSQKDHFFQVDPEYGLSPTTCYKIKRFINKFD